MAETTSDRILAYLIRSGADSKDNGRMIRDIMQAVNLDLENVRLGLQRMLDNSTVEVSDSNRVRSGVPASFRSTPDDRDAYRRDYIEPVTVWLGQAAKDFIAEAGRQTKRDSDLNVIAQSARLMLSAHTDRTALTARGKENLVVKQSHAPLKAYKVFISHSSKDKIAVKALVDLLADPLGIAHTDIFATSADGSGIESGEQWRDAIKFAVMHSTAILLILSENYRRSEICLNEMGAAWMSDALVIPVTLPPITHDSVGVLAQVRQVEQLHDSKGVDKLRDKLVKHLNLKQDIATDRWTDKKEHFLNQVKQPQLEASAQESHTRELVSSKGSNTKPSQSGEDEALPPASTRTNLVEKNRTGAIANRVITYHDWNITKSSLRNGKQHANFQAQSFGTSVLTSLTCKIRLKAAYMRFGVKFRKVEIDNFAQDGSVKQPGTILFHIGKEENSNVIQAWVVRDEPREPKAHVCQTNIGEVIEFALRTKGNVRTGYSMQLTVNGIELFTESLPVDTMSNIVFLAWRDNKEDAAIDVMNLVVSCRARF